MKRFLILGVLFLMAFGAMADAKLSTDSYVYLYQDFAAKHLYFELSPSVTLAVNKATFVFGGDCTLDDMKALDSGNLYLSTGYDLGFMSAYVKPYLYLSGKWGFDTAATFKIPHFPMTLEYTLDEGEKVTEGLITAYVEITF